MLRIQRKDPGIIVITATVLLAAMLTLYLYLFLPEDEFIMEISNGTRGLAAFAIELLFLLGTGILGASLVKRIPASLARLRQAVTIMLCLFIVYCSFVIRYHVYDDVFEPNILEHPLYLQIMYAVFSFLALLAYLLVKLRVVKDETSSLKTDGQ